MTRPAVLDTSVFIAMEQGRGLQRALPDSVGVSVVTLAELELGVLAARTGAARAQRLTTLTSVREQSAGLPADERVASAYARLAAAELAAGRRPRIHDTWSPRRPSHEARSYGPRTRTSQRSPAWRSCGSDASLGSGP